MGFSLDCVIIEVRSSQPQGTKYVGKNNDINFKLIRTNVFDKKVVTDKWSDVQIQILFFYFI